MGHAWVSESDRLGDIGVMLGEWLRTNIGAWPVRRCSDGLETPESWQSTGDVQRPWLGCDVGPDASRCRSVGEPVLLTQIRVGSCSGLLIDRIIELPGARRGLSDGRRGALEGLCPFGGSRGAQKAAVANGPTVRFRTGIDGLESGIASRPASPHGRDTRRRSNGVGIGRGPPVTQGTRSAPSVNEPQATET